MTGNLPYPVVAQIESSKVWNDRERIGLQVFDAAADQRQVPQLSQRREVRLADDTHRTCTVGLFRDDSEAQRLRVFGNATRQSEDLRADGGMLETVVGTRSSRADPVEQSKRE